jgi:predicted thioesterase
MLEEVMELDLSVGLKYREEKTVKMDDTAKVFGSGAAEVFATPMMIGLMEAASMNSVKDYLPKGYSTVGTLVNIKHISATRVGKKVWAEAELIEIDRKRLVFKVTAYDEDKKIGEGTHERFVINDEKFMNNLR